jgi:hypothetical protein
MTGRRVKQFLHIVGASLALNQSPQAYSSYDLDQTRRYWAYPDGVLTSVDSAKAKLVSRDAPDSEKTSKEETLAEEEVTKAAGDIQAAVKQCLVKSRSMSIPTVPLKDAPRYVLTFTFRISDKGRAADVEKTFSSAARKLECLSSAKESLAGMTFTPPPRGRTLNARIEVRGIILSDDDAKGRGFKFYERQMTWDKTLREHREWFACQSHKDCVPRLSGCDPKGVNKRFASQYDLAHQLRELPVCSRMKQKRFIAECIRNRCVVK